MRSCGIPLVANPDRMLSIITGGPQIRTCPFATFGLTASMSSTLRRPSELFRIGMTRNRG
jgi:hypothetical protein